MKDNFLPQEPLVQLFGVHWDDDAEKFWGAVFDQGLTLILTNKDDNDIIALRGIEIITKTDRIDTAGIQDENLRNLLDYLNFCDDHAKFFEHYCVDEAIHFAGLAVSQAYRRRGIATKLLTDAVSFVENLGLKCVYIKGEASSDYSKRVYEKLDFDELYQQIYEEYTVNGKHLMLDKTPHTSNKIYGKCVKKQH
jgi:ribosomal protein S18 acetylase RimI-like enzyme